MDKLKDEFKRLELDCMHKQRDLILQYMKQNESDKELLKGYLERILYSIERIEKNKYDSD